MARIPFDPAGQANARLSEKARLAAFVGLVAFLACTMAYMTLPFFLRQRLCPPSTVWCIASGSVSTILFGMLLIFAAAFVLLVRYGTRFPENQPPRSRRPPSALFVLRHGQVAAIVGVLCGISGLIWVNYLESYYCITPDQILIKGGVFRSTRLSGWDGVTVVRADCGRGRGNFLWSNLRLTLSDGTAMTVPLRVDLLDRDYAIVRSALAGKHYEYRISTTVVPDLCPPDVYPLLANLADRASPPNPMGSRNVPP